MEISEKMNDLYEALKGLTDVPIVIISLVLAVLSHKKIKEDSFWILFALVSVASAMGSVVHVFSFFKTVVLAIWFVLDIVLFEIVRRFACGFASYLSRGEAKLKKKLLIAGIPFWIGAELLLILINKYDLLCLIAYTAICLSYDTYFFIKEKTNNKKTIGFLAVLLVVLILQGCSTYIPYAVVMEHVLISILMIVFYQMGVEEK